MITQKQQKTQKQVDMESPEFNSMIQLCNLWFQECTRFTTNDELYSRLFHNYMEIQDYKERNQWLKVATFRLLSGNASMSGNSQTVINRLNKI